MAQDRNFQNDPSKVASAKAGNQGKQKASDNRDDQESEQRNNRTEAEKPGSNRPHSNR